MSSPGLRAQATFVESGQKVMIRPVASVMNWCMTSPSKSWERGLRKELPTSGVVPFRLVPKDNNRLEIYFDGGFK